MPRLASCIKTYIIDEPSMREKDMNGVCKRVALTFSNRQFRRNVENSEDRNWLQHLSEMAGAILYPKTESLDIMGDYPLNGNVFRT